jgi:hypothetical protein
MFCYNKNPINQSLYDRLKEMSRAISPRLLYFSEGLATGICIGYKSVQEQARYETLMRAVVSKREKELKKMGWA